MVLDHADTDAIVAQAAACRLSNGGQRCNSSKRFIVLDKYYDVFVEKFAAYMASQKVGDPLDPATQIPPMSSKKLVQDIHRQVQESVAQ